ncbi:hypothetical protein [Candidatus Nitrosotenuis cloacae]|uniref:hypothetical protein n=1 Tax=Candidatus Nitrosotenuis cloacae TaxID=1603555 RepID=UPI00227D9FE9|nr:hypothetical protein [Candidatus Nitrosotenuis cloacae]
MQKEIHDFMKNHLDLLVQQAKTYQPFVRTAFPNVNLADACFNLVAGNAFSVFLGQYAMRVRSPTEQDFADFGSLVSQYRQKINEMFSE